MRRRNLDKWLILVWLLYAALVVVYAAIGVWRYEILRAGLDDGIFVQIANSVGSSFSATEEGGANHLLVHASPILVITAPFVAIFHGALGLIVLQSLATAAVIFPLWGMASARFPKYMAFAIVVVAASYPPLSAEAVGDFHELAFAPFLTAGLAWAIDRRAWRWAIAAALLLVCVKEDQFGSLAFIGAFLVVTAGKDGELRRCGMWIAIIAIVAAGLYFGVVRRLIDPSFPYWSFHYYQWWWFPPTPNGFAGPTSPLRLQYLFAALSPLAFLPLLSRRYVFFALPGLAEVLLSHEAITMFIGTHYSATWSGYMLCAFVDGAYWLSKRSLLAAKVATVAAAAISIWTSEYYSPIAPGYFLNRRPTAQDRAKERIFASLPRKASIFSDNLIFAHLGMYARAAMELRNQEYLVFDKGQDEDLLKTSGVRQRIRTGRYVTLIDADGVLVLRRTIGEPRQ